MKAFRWILPSLLLGLSQPVVAGPAGNIVVSHYEPLQRLSLQSGNTAGNQKISNSGPATLSFDALGQSFDLRLESNNGFLSAASRNAIPDGIAVYRGSLAGNAESWARIVVFEGLPRGFVWDGDNLYAIEAPGDSLLNADSSVIYRLADTFVESGTMTCGSQSLSGNGAEIYGKLIGELGVSKARGQLQGPGAVSEIDIGAIGDAEFTTAQGGDTAAVAAIIDRLNRVDGIYSQEIGVQINVPTIETFGGGVTDPFSDEAEAGLLLDELVTYRQNTPAQNSLGLTHLWTGRDLNGTTVGIAFNDVLCRSNVGAGLSEGNDSAAFDSLIAAHEIGHNFGAPHDGVPGACDAEPQTFIMAPMLNGSMQFSPCTKAIMQANANQAFCVSPLPAVDMSVELVGQSPTVLLGANTVLTYNVPNNGSVQATNVVADFAIPANLAIDSVTTTIGNCTNGAGTVNCVLGDVPEFSANSVTISTTPTMVGVGMLDATITADVDDRPLNNQSSLQVTVDPAVNLAVSNSTSISVFLDQSATINITADNLSVLDATGVTLGISFASGVQIDTATWSIGSCSITAQQVDCQAASFANQSSSTLAISVTGIAAGSHGYNVTMSANEADADQANNVASRTVTVHDPEAEDDSGGGALGLAFLWVLGVLSLMRRRRLGND